MRTDRQLTLAFSVLLGLHVVTSLAAVALFGRMAPAIERIIEENVASVSAVEGMLDAALRARLGEPLEVARRNFDEALAVARQNVTEEPEGRALEEIARLSGPALAGDDAAARRLSAELRALGAINRRAMRSADESAQRLGIAGAWAMVVLGAGGFVVGIMTLRRLRRRLVLPLQEIGTVLRAATNGDRLRRCTAQSAPAGDLADTMTMINLLLDRRLEKECSSTLRASFAPPPRDDAPSRGR